MASKEPTVGKQGSVGKRKHNMNSSSDTWNNLEAQELQCDYGSMQHRMISHLQYKETEELVTVLYGIKWQCEGPFKVIYIETSVWQGALKVVYSSAFHRNTHAWAYNWKT